MAADKMLRHDRHLSKRAKMSRRHKRAVEMSQHEISEGRSLFWEFWACACGFWKGKHARVSWPLTVGLVMLALAQIAVQYRLNYWNRDFFNALGRRDAVRLWEEAWLFAPLAGLSVLLSAASVWARMTTQRKW